MGLEGIGIWSAHCATATPARSPKRQPSSTSSATRAIWIPDVGGDVLGSVEAAPRRGAAHRCRDRHPQHLDARAGRGRGSAARRGPSVAAPVPARARREPRAADRPRQSRPLQEAVLEDGRVPRRARRGGRHPYPVDARVLAALRPRMLGLARDRAAGVHPYFVPAEHIAHAREILGADAMIGVELAVVLDTRSVDGAGDRASAHRGLRDPGELHEQPARLRLRRRRLRRPRQRPPRRRDRRVGRHRHDRAARVAAMRDAGADHVCIQVIRPDDDLPRADWRELAPALVG